MSQNYLRGDFAGFGFQPLGSALVILGAKDANAELSALLFDVTSTISGGNTARLGGKQDAAVEFNGFVDIDQPPYLPPQFVLPATRGIILYYLNFVAQVGGAGAGQRAIQIPSIVEKVRYQYAVDSEVRYGFSLKMEARAGLLVYPNF